MSMYVQYILLDYNCITTLFQIHSIYMFTVYSLQCIAYMLTTNELKCCIHTLVWGKQDECNYK